MCGLCRWSAPVEVPNCDAVCRNGRLSSNARSISRRFLCPQIEHDIGILLRASLTRHNRHNRHGTVTEPSHPEDPGRHGPDHSDSPDQSLDESDPNFPWTRCFSTRRSAGGQLDSVASRVVAERAGPWHVRHLPRRYRTLSRCARKSQPLLNRRIPVRNCSSSLTIRSAESCLSNDAAPFPEAYGRPKPVGLERDAPSGNPSP